MNLGKCIDRLRRYASSPKAVLQTLWLLLQARSVRRSTFFDRAWYLRENPDLAASGEDPALHYLFAGAPSGKDPSSGFCGAEYLALNPCAYASGLNPLVHYERKGRRCGLRISFLQPRLADGRADPSWHFQSLAEHQASFPAKVEAIRAKAARGERIRALFFVADAAMFPARALFEAMRHDERFDARICAIPDLRGISAHDPIPAMEKCRAALSRVYPDEALFTVHRSQDGQWPDAIGEFGADIVCHPSPYDLSDFHYNPRWCVGREVLPIYVNYGYPCTYFATLVLALDNYARQWRVLLEGNAALAAYREASAIGGVNGIVVGSIKMDALAGISSENRVRKRVLICPHHSIVGGANSELQLSNFMRFADFFAELPAHFPELDFLLRPHPFLFPVLAHPKFWGPEKCTAWRKRFLSHSNAAWSEMGDPISDFAATDAIVQDCASFLADWMFTGKPCCYMLKPGDDLSNFLPIGRECLKRCHVARDESAIEKFLREVVIADRDPLAASRAVFRQEIAVNFPNAAEAALRSIRNDLGMN